MSASVVCAASRGAHAAGPSRDPGDRPHSGLKFKLCLVGFNDAFKTIRLYKHPCQGCAQTAVLSGNHKTKSVVLFRLFTQTKETPRKEIGL